MPFVLSRRVARVAAMLALVATTPALAQPLDTISYQGRLNDAGTPAEGTFDVRFGLWDAPAAGTQLAEHVSTVVLSQGQGGVFTVNDLPFADLFDGTDRWLSVAVTPQGGTETPLGGRQPVTLAPHAAYAQRSGTTLQDAFDNGEDLQGTLDIGGAVNGRLRVYGDFVSSLLVDLRNDGTRGGRVDIRDTNNNIAGAMSIDPNGGARLRLTRTDAGDNGFVYEGNEQGSGAPRLDLLSEDRAVIFDLSTSGDASVVLPDGSVGAAELSDEPGVAEVHANALSTDIESSPGPVLSRSISVPGAGYVIAVSNLEVLVGFNTGIRQIVSAGLSDEPDAFFEGIELSEDIASNASSGSRNFVISPSMVFPVSDAGTFTCYLVAQETDGNPSNIIRASDAQLTLLYVPTAYGTVGLEVLRSANLRSPETVPGLPAPGLTRDAILAEQLAESQRRLDAMAQRQRELELMLRDQRRRLDEIDAGR